MWQDPELVLPRGRDFTVAPGKDPALDRWAEAYGAPPNSAFPPGGIAGWRDGEAKGYERGLREGAALGFSRALCERFARHFACDALELLARREGLIPVVKADRFGERIQMWRGETLICDVFSTDSDWASLSALTEVVRDYAGQHGAPL